MICNAMCKFPIDLTFVLIVIFEVIWLGQYPARVCNCRGLKIICNFVGGVLKR